MTWPRHWLVSWGGSLFGTDIWQNSLRLAEPGVSDPLLTDGAFADLAADMLDDVANDVRTWFLAANSFHSGAATLEWCKVNAIGPTGRYLDEGMTHENRYGGTPVVQPSGVEPAEPQLAWAVSLVTGKRRGPAARGRFFVPIRHVPLSRSTPVIGGGLNGQMADTARTFLNNMNNWPGLDAPFSPVVHVVSDIGSGHKEPVTGVRVGDRVDTQRRRANAFPETYETRAL